MKSVVLLIALIFIVLISGCVNQNQTTATTTTTSTVCSMIQEPYQDTETYIEWAASYSTIFQKTDINIPKDQPASTAVTLNDNSKYVVTFGSDVYAHHMVLNTENKIKFESGVVYSTGMRDNWNIYGKSTTQSTIPFELQSQEGGMYYFIFDQSGQRTSSGATSGTGSLTIQELKGTEQTRQVTKYRTIERCV